jgi:hypothetical protein
MQARVRQAKVVRVEGVRGRACALCFWRAMVPLFLCVFRTAGLPGLYWNAAGAMYAYLFGQFVVDGIDVLGHSQLAGSPEIPDWGIPLPQYPSVSLLSWKTGYGNARYWSVANCSFLALLLLFPRNSVIMTCFIFVPSFSTACRPVPSLATACLLPQLRSVSPSQHPHTHTHTHKTRALKLLIDHFAPGDLVIDTRTQFPPAPPTPGLPIFCAASSDPAYPSLTFACNDPAATINEIIFADYGTVQGGPDCGSYKSGGSCVDTASARAYAESTCLNRASCTLSPGTLPDPCVGTPKSFVVSASCTGSAGGHVVTAQIDPVFAQAFVSGSAAAGGAGKRRLLLINKTEKPQTVDVSALFAQQSPSSDSLTAEVYLVDPLSVQDSAAQGVRVDVIFAYAGSVVVYALQPFAIAVLELAA